MSTLPYTARILGGQPSLLDTVRDAAMKITSPPSLQHDQPQRHFRLLDLPPELRNWIYELLIGNRATIVIGASRSGFPPMCKIALVSRQARAEVLPVLFNRRTICIYAHRGFVLDKWVSSWYDAISAYFRYIRLEDYQHFHRECPARHNRRCFSAISIDVMHATKPAVHEKDPSCRCCPEIEKGVDRVNAVILGLQRVQGSWLLTKEGMWRILEAAAWNDDVGKNERYGEAGFWLSAGGDGLHQEMFPYELVTYESAKLKSVELRAMRSSV